MLMTAISLPNSNSKMEREREATGNHHEFIAWMTWNATPFPISYCKPLSCYYQLFPKESCILNCPLAMQKFTQLRVIPHSKDREGEEVCLPLIK